MSREEHTRNHETDGFWHDDCLGCLERRRTGRPPAVPVGVQPEPAEEAAMSVSVSQWAEHLVRLSWNVRSAGDVALALMDETGAEPAPVSLADELFVVALNLDYDAANTANRAEIERNPDA